MYMKNLLLMISCCSLALWGCRSSKKTDEPKPDNPALFVKDEIKVTPQSATFEMAFAAFITGLNEEDFKKVDKFIDPEQGYYFVLNGKGVYSDDSHYKTIESMFEDSRAAGEFEVNPFKHFLDMLANLSKDELEIVEQPLGEQDACDFEGTGVFLDTDSVKTTLLSDIYQQNAHRDEKEIDVDELKKRKDFEATATKRVFIGDKDGTDIFYFSKIGHQWRLAIIDMRDCSS